MQNANYLKQSMLLSVPFLLGWTVSSSYFFMGIFGSFSLILSMCMSIYWCWVGSIFSRQYSNKLQGFMVGNSIWGISATLFISQFMMTDNNARNGLISVIGQAYMIFFSPIASKILGAANVNDGTMVIMASYILMLMVFSIGYYSGTNNNKSNYKHDYTKYI